MRMVTGTHAVRPPELLWQPLDLPLLEFLYGREDCRDNRECQLQNFPSGMASHADYVDGLPDCFYGIRYWGHGAPPMQGSRCSE